MLFRGVHSFRVLCSFGWCTPPKTCNPQIGGLKRCFSFSKEVFSGPMLVFRLCMLLYRGVSLHITETLPIHLTWRKFDGRPTQMESTSNMFFYGKYVYIYIEFHYFTTSMFNDVLLKSRYLKQSYWGLTDGLFPSQVLLRRLHAQLTRRCWKIALQSCAVPSTNCRFRVGRVECGMLCPVILKVFRGFPTNYVYNILVGGMVLRKGCHILPAVWFVDVICHLSFCSSVMFWV